MSKAHRILDRTTILAAVITVAVGLFLMSFGTALKVQEHRSYPNTQHISPPPGTAARR